MFSIQHPISLIDSVQMRAKDCERERLKSSFSEDREASHPSEATNPSEEFQRHYLIFAGVDGSGKSSLYHAGLWWSERFPRRMERVNIGEVIWQNRADRDNPADRQNAAEVVAEKIEDCFARGVSFNQEITFTEQDCLQNIERALDLDYGVFLFYVGVNCSEATRGRVVYRKRSRSSLPAVMKQKYETSLCNLRAAIGMCHETYLFDNSYQLALIKAYERGRLVFNGENPQVMWTREF